MSKFLKRHCKEFVLGMRINQMNIENNCLDVFGHGDSRESLQRGTFLTGGVLRTDSSWPGIKCVWGNSRAMSFHIVVDKCIDERTFTNYFDVYAMGFHVVYVHIKPKRSTKHLIIIYDHHAIVKMSISNPKEVLST